MKIVFWWIDVFKSIAICELFFVLIIKIPIWLHLLRLWYVDIPNDLSISHLILFRLILLLLILHFLKEATNAKQTSFRFEFIYQVWLLHVSSRRRFWIGHPSWASNVKSIIIFKRCLRIMTFILYATSFFSWQRWVLIWI